ncbi:MAG: alginate O-acetyltransferase [Desulfobulbaceae bacterium BRH_c16a]|nr:MAG: alginate O-acetyltransferase [Desulfobulbaceae bacterium BRH_c16a]
MVFSSITFLFFFLPAVLAITFCSGKWKNPALLLASLLFYAWGEGIYLLVMIGSIVMNFTCGRLMRRGTSSENPSRTVLLLAIIGNFALLGFFKYANFIAENLNTLLVQVHLPSIELGAVHLPIGISFFTFQAVSYLIDVYRGKVQAQTSLIRLGLYISLFPQLIAGPIVRYHDIATSLAKRKVDMADFSAGVQRFLLGLSKKVLLANPLAFTADKIFALPQSDLTSPLAWLGAICYTLQIYYDFSGYSDMAIGLGRMFGFRFLENFNYPYISGSIREFWRRWHISLSSWFRDYLYIPLGGSRRGKLRTYLNLLIVFLLCGLWHGASWTFVCWGLYHGFFLVIERTRLGSALDLLWRPLRYSLTLCIIVVGWVIFRSDSIGFAFSYLGIMFGAAEETGRLSLSMYTNQKLIFELTMAVIFAVPVLPALRKLHDRLIGRCSTSTAFSLEAFLAIGRLSVLAVLSYFSAISLAAGVYNPFIYFRF